MVKTVLDLFDVHREMILGNTPVVIQDVLGITPEALDAVDVAAGVTIDEGAPVNYHVMLAVALEGLVTPESIGVVDRALACVGLDMAHELLGREVGDHPSIDPSIPFQQVKHETFAGSSPTAFAFATAAEVGFIRFDLALEFAAFQFDDMEQSFPQPLVNTWDYLGIDTQILDQAVGRLQLVEAFQDFYLTREPDEAFTFAAMPAFDVTAHGSQHAERTTENTLATPQKVGRIGKMTRFPCNHNH